MPNNVQITVLISQNPRNICRQADILHLWPSTTKVQRTKDAKSWGSHILWLSCKNTSLKGRPTFSNTVYTSDLRHLNFSLKAQTDKGAICQLFKCQVLSASSFMFRHYCFMFSTPSRGLILQDTHRPSLSLSLSSSRTYPNVCIIKMRFEDEY